MILHAYVTIDEFGFVKQAIITATPTVDSIEAPQEISDLYEIYNENYYYENNTWKKLGLMPDGYSLDKVNKCYFYSLDNGKLKAWDKIKIVRNKTIEEGFTWDGSLFDSTQTSQQQINGAVTLAMLNPAFSVTWTLANNTTRVLNQTDMFQIGAALGSHVQTQFAKGVALRQQIEAATTQLEVEAVIW